MGKLFPLIYDVAMKPIELSFFKWIRIELLKEATGRVLEIGSGSGINFPLYKNAYQVDAIEPNQLMKQRARKRETKATNEK